jgi:hypothetical protein
VFETAIVGLAVAALSYVGKLIVEAAQHWRRLQDERQARLFRLLSLLRASKVAFDIQNELADRLSAMLATHHPECESVSDGYDALFAALYDKFNEEEHDLYGVIRGITLYAMRPANQAISKWLDEDIDFRNERRKHAQLAVQLNLLASHLILWHAKFEAWIPTNPKHSLVYMEDEKQHGLGFPHAVDGEVAAALREMQVPLLDSARRRLKRVFK